MSERLDISGNHVFDTKNTPDMQFSTSTPPNHGKAAGIDNQVPTVEQLVNHLHECATDGERKRAKKILKRGL